MAKRKNAAALFEVIHTDNRFPKRHDPGTGWSLRAPRWFRRRSGGEATPVRAERVERVEYAAPSVPAGPSLLARLAGVAAGLVPPMPRFRLDADPERQTVRFQLSYTAAAIGAFAILAGIALAYVVGRQTATRPRPALAEAPTDELRSGPANPQVLDIGGDDDNGAPLALASGSVPAASAGTRGSTQSAPTAAPQQPSATGPKGRLPSWNQPAGPTTLVVSDSKRTVGLTYVVIQSYPPQERQMAQDAVKLLNGNGVLCTTETGLPYAPNWISVVGITGFDRIRDSQEYTDYVARIEAISDTMDKTLKFKRFDPKPFKWRESKQ